MATNSPWQKPQNSPPATAVQVAEKQPAPPKVAAVPSNRNCLLQSITYEASKWNEMLPPEATYGQGSLDFIKNIYRQSCQPVLQAVHPKRVKALLPNGFNPGSVLVLGKGEKRVAALVQICGKDGTCQALVRLPDKVHTIKINLNNPHVYQNKRGEVINTLLNLPGSQQVATAGELLLEAHQAYGRGETAGKANLATNDDI